MILPVMPEIIHESPATASVRQHLCAIRQSLEKACRDIDEQIRVLDQSSFTGSQAATEAPETRSLFEIPPSSFQPEIMQLESIEPETTIVMAASEPSVIDPQLEQATLEELNQALSRAFVQMSSRAQW
ncbi:MAG: hypothetical protein RL015_121 [Verrucomicrobiota bacterium]|jgi:hypothetical protein